MRTHMSIRVHACISICTLPVCTCSSKYMSIAGQGGCPSPTARTSAGPTLAVSATAVYSGTPHFGGSGTLEGSRARLYSQEKRNKQPPLASKIRSAGFSLFLGPKRGGREREKKQRRHRCVHLTRSRPHYQGNHLCQAACLLSLLVAIGGLLWWRTYEIPVLDERC